MISSRAFVIFLFLHITEIFGFGNTKQHGFSENLVSFFDFTLSRCITRVILNPKSKASENILVRLVRNSEGRQMLGPGLIEHFRKRKFQSSNNNYVEYVGIENYGEPFWLHSRHTTCFAHMYILTSTKDAQVAITSHFIHFDLTKESPHFVIFWEYSKHIEMREYTRMKQFAGSFMDYRILITRGKLSGQYEVNLMSMIYSVVKNQASV